MGPYRTPSPPLDAERSPAPPPNRDRPDVGQERSTHHLTGATALLTNAAGKSTRLIVCDGGLRIREDGVRCTTERVVPFDAIHFLYYELDELLTKAPGVTLVTDDGFRWRVPRELEERALVLAALKRKVTQPLARAASGLFDDGEVLTFESVSVSQAGVELHGLGSLGWTELLEVVAEPQAIVFYRREPRGRFGWARLACIPNPGVLLHILGTHARRLRVTFEGVTL